MRDGDPPRTGDGRPPLSVSRLDAELDAQPRPESLWTGHSMVALIREALREHFNGRLNPMSRHAGSFASGYHDTVEDVDAALRETCFGND